MEYLFDEGSGNGRKLLLLHGTGGDETSLVDVARYLDGESTLLAFRGTIQEGGMNRFFRRNGLNQFDIESLEVETDRLLAEIQQHSQQTGIPMEDWTLVGYSNGANIAAHLLLERETPIKQAVLLHPMSLGVQTQEFSLADKKIWLSYGKGDPIVSEAAINELTLYFEKRQADLTIEIFEMGHQVTMDELAQAREWLANVD